MDIVGDEDNNNNNNIIIADIVGVNSPNEKIEEYTGVDQNFEQYINNDTIENKIFDFKNNKLNFSFQNKTFINCHFYNYKNRPFYDRNLRDDFKNDDDEDTIFEVNVKNSNFINCRFDEIIFFKATFDNNTTFENCFFHEIDLFFSKFNNCYMAGSNFSHCNLITYNEFNRCDMAGSKFSDCKFATGIKFNLCDMAGSKFNSCDMAGCNFTKSNVSECIFHNCIINYKIFENSYIIIGIRHVVLKRHILRHINRYGDYTGKISHLSLKSVGNIIEKEIQEFIKTTKEELASKNINDDIAEIVIGDLFPIEQRSRSREHSKLSVRNNTNNRNTSRSRSRDRPHTSRSRSRGGKGKKTRKFKNK